MTLSRLEIETCTQRILDQIELQQPVEDDLVEVKAEWPTDFGKIARRVAGHANSAGQHPILWIIGADEKAGIVTGAAPLDAATWYAQVRSEFADGWAPDIAVHNVPRNGHVVVALVFYTESAPYLVKAGPDRFDIPWRSSTGIRSARRQEVFRIFTTEVVDFPDFKLREVSVRALANRRQPPGTIVGHTFELSALLYVIPRSAKAVYFPLYDTLFRFIPNGGDAIDVAELRASLDNDSHNATADERQFGVTGPAFVKIRSGAQLPITVAPEGPLEVRIHLVAAGSSRIAVLTANLLPKTTNDPNLSIWS